MKNIIKTLILILAFIPVGCTDDELLETSSGGKEFNMPQYADGYSVCFDINFDNLGTGMATRDDDINDVVLEQWENHLQPEEFRVLFFDQYDRFLFESRSRWFTATQSEGGGNRWRIGVPVFQYLSDEYDDNNSDTGSADSYTSQRYNWHKIVEIMRSEPFKIAVMANRPESVEVPNLADWPTKDDDPDNIKLWDKLKSLNAAKNGPFWSPNNSIAADDITEENIRTVFDLHHCQLDPLYFSKSRGNNGKTQANGYGWYDFIMDFQIDHEYDDVNTNALKLPYMGAMSCWVAKDRKRDQDGRSGIRYYRLPVDRVVTDNNSASSSNIVDAYEQYIPMYGIQEFAPLTTWMKGTTFNLSTQSGSQTGNYDYKTISLLRSVVKLELRIPWYDQNGYEIEVDNENAQIWFNNYMARCEPLDVSTPTDKLWEVDHTKCEWIRIKNFGPLADQDASGLSFKERLSWFYGYWQSKGWWTLQGDGLSSARVPIYPEGDPKANPRIFNPITQRLQVAYIRDCYLPIEGKFHRWVIYCGERNINDPSRLGELTTSYIPFLRVKVKRNNQDEIYCLPITDYSQSGNPAKKYLKSTDEYITTVNKNPNQIANYYAEIEKMKKEDYDLLPFPLVRNHFYRLTVTFNKDDDDINVQIMNAEQRNVTGIFFN